MKWAYGQEQPGFGRAALTQAVEDPCWGMQTSLRSIGLLRISVLLAVGALLATARLRGRLDDYLHGNNRTRPGQ